MESPPRGGLWLQPASRCFLIFVWRDACVALQCLPKGIHLFTEIERERKRACDMHAQPRMPGIKIRIPVTDVGGVHVYMHSLWIQVSRWMHTLYRTMPVNVLRHDAKRHDTLPSPTAVTLTSTSTRRIKPSMRVCLWRRGLPMPGVRIPTARPGLLGETERV